MTSKGTNDKSNLDIELDNYFNNVDLGMCSGKIVGHKKYVKSLIEAEVEKAVNKTIHDICGIACDNQRDAWINGEAFMMAISRYKEK